MNQLRGPAAFTNGIGWAAGSLGYLGHELRRSIEYLDRYVLRVEWAPVEDHTVRFADRKH